MAKEVLPEPAASRYANQVLALHRALGLLRMFDLDPTRRPSAVREAIRILDDATDPLRTPPRRTQQAPPPRPQRAAPAPPPRPPAPAPVKPKKAPEVSSDHEEKIKRRMAVGMTREMAEYHISSGSSIGPDGEDLDAPLNA